MGTLSCRAGWDVAHESKWPDAWMKMGEGVSTYEGRWRVHILRENQWVCISVV